MRAGKTLPPFDPCFGCATDRGAPMPRPRELMRTERVGTRFQTPRPSAPSIVTRTIETDATRHGVSAGERTSRIDCRGSGIRGLHSAPFAEREKRRKLAYWRSSHESIRKRWTDFGRGPYSVNSVIKSPCPQSELTYGCSTARSCSRCPLTRARCEARLATPAPLGNSFSMVPVSRSRMAVPSTE